MTDEHLSPIPYAVPASTPASRVWAAGAILAGGLALAAIGGCFLIGVLIVVESGAGSTSDAQQLLLVVLYGLALLAFVAAAFVIVAGLRGLFRVLNA